MKDRDYLSAQLIGHTGDSNRVSADWHSGNLRAGLKIASAVFLVYLQIAGALFGIRNQSNKSDWRF